MSAKRKQTMLCECVRKSVEGYLRDLNGEEVSDVYRLVLHEIEKPLLEVVMRHTEHNQAKASKVLGINRDTLRKKLARHGVLN